MSRTHAHKPFTVIEMFEYGEPAFRGPRVDPDNPWVWVPGTTERGMPWWQQWKHFRSHPGDTAAAKQQRRAMRRKRHQQDHLLALDPDGYDDMPSTREKINRWALPSW